MTTLRKRIAAVVSALMMVMNTLPVSAFANDEVTEIVQEGQGTVVETVLSDGKTTIPEEDNAAAEQSAESIVSDTEPLEEASNEATTPEEAQQDVGEESPVIEPPAEVADETSVQSDAEPDNVADIPAAEPQAVIPDESSVQEVTEPVVTEEVVAPDAADEAQEHPMALDARIKAGQSFYVYTKANVVVYAKEDKSEVLAKISADTPVFYASGIRQDMVNVWYLAQDRTVRIGYAELKLFTADTVIETSEIAAWPTSYKSHEAGTANGTVLLFELPEEQEEVPEDTEETVPSESEQEATQTAPESFENAEEKTKNEKQTEVQEDEKDTQDFAEEGIQDEGDTPEEPSDAVTGEEKTDLVPDLPEEAAEGTPADPDSVEQTNVYICKAQKPVDENEKEEPANAGDKTAEGDPADDENNEEKPDSIPEENDPETIEQKEVKQTEVQNKEQPAADEDAKIGDESVPGDKNADNTKADIETPEGGQQDEIDPSSAVTEPETDEKEKSDTPTEEQQPADEPAGEVPDTEKKTPAADAGNYVRVAKVDQNGNLLAGAEFALLDKDANFLQTAVSDENGIATFHMLASGEYTVQETKAPAGYLLSREAFALTIDAMFVPAEEPVHAFINPEKRMSFRKTDTAGEPLSGAEFVLINKDSMTHTESAVSDADGRFSFTGIDYGNWIVRETKAPDGYNIMPEYEFSIDSGWTTPDEILLVDIPDHYEFRKVNNGGIPLAGVSFSLETDETFSRIGLYTSDENGVVSINGLKPGKYILRETSTLEGYAKSEDVWIITIDENYIPSSKLPEWINYPIIRTGVEIENPYTIAGIMTIIMASIAMIVLVNHKKKKN